MGDSLLGKMRPVISIFDDDCYHERDGGNIWSSDRKKNILDYADRIRNPFNRLLMYSSIHSSIFFSPSPEEECSRSHTTNDGEERKRALLRGSGAF